jgi:hypothetical protein
MSSLDVVGIFDNSTFVQLFQNSRPIRAEVLETSKVMQHPVETGVMLSDHHIINPIRINLQLIVNSQFYATDYQQIRTAFFNATNLNVQTKTTVYPNMIIAEMPHQETPDGFDIIVIHLNFQEVIFITPIAVSPSPAPANYSPTNQTDTNTQQWGQQSTATNITLTPAQIDSINSYAGGN